MEIIDGYIDWMEDFSNRPYLQLLIKDPPKIEDLRYQQKEWAFFAEKDGYCSFYSWHGWKNDSNSGGYGGSHHKIIMLDGTEKILKGPWSSNGDSMEEMGFGPTVYVTSKIVNDIYDMNYQTYLRPEIIKQNLHKLKPFNLKKPPKFFDIIKNGKVGFDFKNQEPFIDFENGECFYKPKKW